MNAGSHLQQLLVHAGITPRRPMPDQGPVAVRQRLMGRHAAPQATTGNLPSLYEPMLDPSHPSHQERQERAAAIFAAYQRGGRQEVLRLFRAGDDDDADFPLPPITTASGFAHQLADYLADRFAPVSPLPACPTAELIGIWNEVATGTRLTRCRALNPERRKKLTARWADTLCGNIELWRAVCVEVRASDWPQDHRAGIDHALWAQTLARYVDRVTSVPRYIPHEVTRRLEQADRLARLPLYRRIAEYRFLGLHGHPPTLFDWAEMERLTLAVEHDLGAPRLDGAALAVEALGYAA